MKPKSQVKTAVGYARIASINQGDGATIKIQEEKIREYCTKNDLKLSKIYTDLGKSGISSNRPALIDMLAHCSKGNIEHLIVCDTSRLSRNVQTYLTVRAVLTQYKVELISLNGVMPPDNDLYSKFFDEIIACVNALHPRLSNVKRRKKIITADVS